MINEGKYNKYLDIEVSCKDVKDGSGKLLAFYGIKSQDVHVVRDRIIEHGTFNVIPGKHIAKAWFKGETLMVIVPAGEEDDFLNTGLKSIQGALIQTGHYNNDSILRLTDETAQKMDTISDAEKNQMYKDASASEIEMWRYYLNTVNDEKTRKVLELYSQIYGDTVYGHALSLKNVMTIRNINPDATFVLGASTWREFGRGIKRGAKKYPLYGCKFSEDPSKADIAAAQKALGHGLEEWGDLGITVQQEIMIRASKGKGMYIPFRYFGYDIADTYQYDANGENLLVTKPGISSNVIYTLNALAKEIEDQKKAEKGESIEGDDLMKQRTSLALDALDKYCIEKGITTPQQSPDASPSAALVDKLISIYTSLAEEKANVLTAGNIRNIAEDCTHLTLIMDNIALDQLNRFRHPLEYTQKDMAALAPMLRNVITVVGRAANVSLNEGGEDNFMSRLKSAMEQIGMTVTDDMDSLDKEKIMETFKKWCNRIENADITKSIF